MTRAHTLSRLIVVGLVASVVGGNVGCHLYRTVEVRVVDIETREPIARATVATRYMVFLGDFFPPRPREFMTDDAGLARVWIARGWNDRVDVSASAAGFERGFYLTPTGSSIRPIENPDDPENASSIHLFPRRSNRDPLPDALVAELWRGPSPRFVVIIPNTFRGRLILELRADRVHTFKPGERKLEVRADGGGRVRLPLTRPILTQFSAEEITFRFESGGEIPKTFPVTTRGGFVIRGQPTTAPAVANDAVAIRRVRGGVVVGDADLAKTVNAASRPAAEVGN